jgi:hypothetical protein
MFRCKKPVTPLNDIIGRIETFWILNCEHKEWWWRLIGHTAVIWRDPETGLFWVYESTQMGAFGTKGVQLTPLRTWLKHYPGGVKIKPVTITNPMLRTEAFRSADEHVEKHLGKPYTDPKKRQGRWVLIRSIWDSSFFKHSSTNIDTDKWFFCTMLVMHFFRYCRVVYKDINPAEWEPDNTRDEPRGRLQSVINGSYVVVGIEITIK